MADIDKLLNQGWLVGVELNVRQLQKRHGFNGHMVLIFDKNNDNYVLHDPGLPGRPSSLIARQDFYGMGLCRRRQDQHDCFQKSLIKPNET